MTLKETIQKDLVTALKAKDLLKVSVLKLVMASVKNKEIEKRGKYSKFNPDETTENLLKESELDADEMTHVLNMEVKKRKDSAEQFRKGNRPELAEKEEKEIVIIKAYLPEDLSEEKVKEIIAEVLSKTGAKGPADFGRVMKELTPLVKGRVDGNLVVKLVKEKLS
jgi:hypothetical protein